ncbi:hypothetical protein BV25DRAFT_1831119 [Artomyces pyxidatus]|uniref:Uncharacterized protein n=1 Tax=Artomyces pyxidatus TaxID=48021 RepID=A0ACB8SNY7_9AGAM|nr:hypothetical protein BV25DRAFT_1831119 [Artomyces pyxidatus]
MGRAVFSSAPAVAIVTTPELDAQEYPSYAKWSYNNAWDPDSEEFFEDAVYEAVVPPVDPIAGLESVSSSASSSGRGSPIVVDGTRPAFPLPTGEDPSNEDFLQWMARVVPDSMLDTLRRSASDASVPIPVEDEGEMLSHYAARYDVVSQDALDRMQARQRSRMRLSQPAPEEPPSGARVFTSEITPIPLPSSTTHAALVASLRDRAVTPPQRIPRQEADLNPSPPPSVSPRVYSWPVVHPQSPSAPAAARARVGPARWPVY